MIPFLNLTLFQSDTTPIEEVDLLAPELSVFDHIQVYVENHIKDGQEWHLPGLHLYLPEWFTLHAVMLVIAALFLIMLFVGIYDRRQRIPQGVTNLLEVFILFIRDDIAIPALGEKDGRKMAPLFCTFFFFVLCLNIMGLIPLFSSATANPVVTGSLALITFAVMIGGALLKNGPGGLASAFMPGGVPKVLLLLLTPLEIVSLFIKIFALAIRLFANMMAGHVVVLTLVGMAAAFGVYGVPAIGMAVFIMLIKILVSFIQAYVFTLLSAIFIGQIHHPAH